MTKPNHCIWPIRTHHRPSTNEQFAPNEDDLTMLQQPSTITILYIWSLVETGGNLPLNPLASNQGGVLFRDQDSSNNHPVLHASITFPETIGFSLNILMKVSECRWWIILMLICLHHLILQTMVLPLKPKHKQTSRIKTF